MNCTNINETKSIKDTSLYCFKVFYWIRYICTIYITHTDSDLLFILENISTSTYSLSWLFTHSISYINKVPNNFNEVERRLPILLLMKRYKIPNFVTLYYRNLKETNVQIILGCCSIYELISKYLLCDVT